MIKKTLLFLFILSAFVKANACRVPYKLNQLFFKTDLIVKAKIVSHTKQYYRIVVLDVYNDKNSGIKEGDYILVWNDFNTSATDFHIQNAIEKKTILAFLTNYENKWYLQFGNFSFFINGMAEIGSPTEGFSTQGNSSSLKKSIQNYYQEFQFDTLGRVTGKKSIYEILTTPLSDLTLFQYSRIYFPVSMSISYRLPKDKYHIQESEEEDKNSINKDSIIFNRASITPIPLKSLPSVFKGLYDYIEHKSDSIQLTNNAEMIYYVLTFEKDGTISNTRLINSPNPKLDRLVKRYFQKNKNWRPAINEAGEAIRFRHIFPIITTFD